MKVVHAATLFLVATASASWRFDGSPTAALDYGDLTVVTGGETGAFSCFCVVKLDSIGGDDAHCVGKRTGDGGGWTVGLDGATDRFRFRVSGGPGQETERVHAQPAAAGAWVALGGSYEWDDPGPGDGTGNMTLYVDGVDDPSPSRLDHFRRPLDHADPLTIGRDAADPAASLSGRVGHAAIWDGVALTAADHALLAAGADPRTVRPDRLVFYASLEDVDAEDLAGGALPAVLPGATFSVDRWPSVAPLVVALGDATPTSIRVMSHVGRASEHRIEYAVGGFPGTLTPPVLAVEDDDYVAATAITGLAPGTTYDYRVVVDDVVLDATTSTFTTAPPGAGTFSFVFASCTEFDHSEPPYDRYRFDALRGVLDRAPAFVVHAGDVWYADSGGSDETTEFDAWGENTVEAFNRKARETLSEKHFARLLGRLPVYSMPDDHEWRNNLSDVAGLEGVAEVRYQNGLERVLNWQFSRNPQRLPKAVEDGGLWYTFSYGGVDFFFLDLRTQRSWDLAPNDAEKKMLGPDDRQLQDLIDWLTGSTAPFRVILAPGMISRFGTTGSDAWGTPQGFSTDAEAVLEEISRFENVVFLAGDVHWSGAVRLAAHPDGDPAHDLYELIAGPYAGHLSDPAVGPDDDLLFTYDGRTAKPERMSYLHVTVDTAAVPPVLVAEIVSNDPVGGEETVEYVHPAILSRCAADCGARPDGTVGVVDLLALLAAWGTADPACDAARDGVIDVGDLLAMLSRWGPCWPAGR